ARLRSFRPRSRAARRPRKEGAPLPEASGLLVRPASPPGAAWLGLHLEPQQLAAHEELISVVDEGRRAQPDEGPVGAAEIAHHHAPIAHGDEGVPPRDEAVGGEGDVAELAAEEVVPVAQGEGPAARAPLEELDQPEVEARIGAAPGDGAALTGGGRGDRLEHQALAAQAELAADGELALGPQALEDAVAATGVLDGQARSTEEEAGLGG